MTDAGGHAAAAAHAPIAHGTGHDAPGGHGDHDGEEPLGPVDVPAWMAGIIGVAIGCLTALCFVAATAGAGAY